MGGRRLKYISKGHASSHPLSIEMSLMCRETNNELHFLSNRKARCLSNRTYFTLQPFIFSSTRLSLTVSETWYVQYTLWLSQRGQQVGLPIPLSPPFPKNHYSNAM